MRHLSPIVLTTLLLAACADTVTDTDTDLPEQESSSSIGISSAPSSESSQAAGIVPVDETWNRYINRQWRFSILIPEAVHADLFMPDPRTDVIAFEDPSNMRVFLAQRYAYAGPTDASIPTTLEMLIEDGPRTPPYWEVVGKTVRSDTELEAFIKDRYGSDCSVGEKKSTAQEGTFDVEITGRVSPDEGDCFVNYLTVIKYSPSHQKVISWHLGQDFRFRGPLSSNDSDGKPRVYDAEMVESFRFERG